MRFIPILDYKEETSLPVSQQLKGRDPCHSRPYLGQSSQQIPSEYLKLHNLEIT